MPGKLAAIDQHFGQKWVDRLILTHDRTLVRGHVLIDDKGVITGAAVPTWKHLIHDRSHNRDVTGKPRMTDGRKCRGHGYPLLGAVSVYDTASGRIVRCGPFAFHGSNLVRRRLGISQLQAAEFLQWTA